MKRLIHLLVFAMCLFHLVACWSSRKCDIDNCFEMSMDHHGKPLLINKKTNESILLRSSTGEKTCIYWYQGEQNKVQLESIARDVSWNIPIKGYSDYSSLMLSVKHLVSDNVHEVNFHPDKKGQFNLHYILKDGPGDYRVIIYGVSKNGSKQFRPLIYFKVKSTGHLPVGLNELILNKYMVEFIDSVLGSIVGSGDFWDLIQTAMTEFKGDMLHGDTPGVLINPDSEDVLPGDIIWFRNTVFDYTRPSIILDPYLERIGSPNHFGIVYKVKSRKMFQIAHQNVGDKRTVAVSNINLNKVAAGRYFIYRPVVGLISIQRDSLQITDGP